MTRRSAWLLGGAIAAMAGMLLVDLTGLAWPRFDRLALADRIAWAGLLGLGQLVLRRAGLVDLAAGATVVLVAGLILNLAPTMGLPLALGGALLVALSATVSQTALATRARQPAWLGLGFLLLLLAAMPDTAGHLAADTLRRLAMEAGLLGLPWSLWALGGLAGLVCLVRWAVPAWAVPAWTAAAAAAGLWWWLGLLAAGSGRTSPTDALAWCVEGLAVAGLAGRGVVQGLLAAIIVGCALQAASLAGTQRAEWVVLAVCLIVTAQPELWHRQPAEVG